jgi:hypothetical protein
MASPRFLVLTGMRQHPLSESYVLPQSETRGRLKFNLPPVR